MFFVVYLYTIKHDIIGLFAYINFLHQGIDNSEHIRCIRHAGCDAGLLSHRAATSSDEDFIAPRGTF